MCAPRTDNLAERHDSPVSVSPRPSVAVLIPCYNEEAAIGIVIADFSEAVPDATIYVYDNGSEDNTIAVAHAAGAIIGRVPLRGKGNVVRRMFADTEADIYVLVDGDDTYDAPSSPKMIEKLWKDRLDMLVGTRTTTHRGAYRVGHRFGNAMLTAVVSGMFGAAFTDVLSGYRVFSRRFVKSFPALAAGFETEIELTIHALELRMPMGEVVTPYKVRPAGSQSKLRTYRDGARILMTIFKLLKQERPLGFFSILCGFLATTSLVLSVPVLVTYFETGLVPRLPTALLSTGLMLLAFLSLACGLILHTVTRGRQEMKRLFYLSIPPPGEC